MAITHFNRTLCLQPLSLALWHERYACAHTFLHLCVHTLENTRLAIAGCSNKVTAGGGHER